jgi:hypothetical protein
MLAWFTAEYPFTILSHFYYREDIRPLFLTHAIESEEGCSYDPKLDAVRTPEIAELGLCLAKDAKVFAFDLALVETDQGQADKKRKIDGPLVKRLDEASIGTLRADQQQNTAAGFSRAGTRPGP